MDHYTTLMIFGLVGATILVNVMILLMQMMFTYAAGLVAIESNVGPVAMIILFFIYVWLAIKIVHRSLDMINEVPSGIMKWIGGGHDPLDGSVAQQGNSFVGGIMNKGEGGAQAAGAARKGLKDKDKAKDQFKDSEASKDARNDKLVAAVGGNKSEPSDIASK